MTDRPYTVSSAARHLACSTATVRKLCRIGRLRHYRLGGEATGRIRIPAAAMEEYEGRVEDRASEDLAETWDRLIDAYKS